jgi:taurine dioxygenase
MRGDVMRSAFDVRPIEKGLLFGVEIVGLRADDLTDQEVQARLRHHWAQDGLLIFRGLDGEKAHVDLSRAFGPLLVHPLRTDPSRQEIFTVRHDPDDPYIVEVDGKPLAAWLPWHSDLIYVDHINHGGILRPLALPRSAGETGYIDKIAAYDALPQRLRNRLEGLEAIYQFDRNPERQKFGRANSIKVLHETRAALASKSKTYPRALHPIVYEQAETGRKVLNISPWFLLGIAGLSEEESDDLLHEIVDYVIDPRLAYWHRWQIGEMVLWDNWRMLHSAAGCAPAEQRWMERTTIAGDYGLGRLEGEQAIDSSTIMDV